MKNERGDQWRNWWPVYWSFDQYHGWGNEEITVPLSGNGVRRGGRMSLIQGKKYPLRMPWMIRRRPTRAN